MTLDNLTVKAQEAVAGAQQQAASRSHQQMEPEHLLLALLEDPDGVPSAILKKVGASTRDITAQLAQQLDSMPKVYGADTGRIYLSPQAEKLMRKAEEEMRNSYIRTYNAWQAWAEANPKETHYPDIQKFMWRRDGMETTFRYDSRNRVIEKVTPSERTVLTYAPGLDKVASASRRRPRRAVLRL